MRRKETEVNEGINIAEEKRWMAIHAKTHTCTHTHRVHFLSSDAS